MRNLLGVILGLLALVQLIPVNALTEAPTEDAYTAAEEAEREHFLVDSSYLPRTMSDLHQSNTTVQETDTKEMMSDSKESVSQVFSDEPDMIAAGEDADADSNNEIQSTTLSPLPTQSSPPSVLLRESEDAASFSTQSSSSVPSHTDGLFGEGHSPFSQSTTPPVFTTMGSVSHITSSNSPVSESGDEEMFGLHPEMSLSTTSGLSSSLSPSTTTVHHHDSDTEQQAPSEPTTTPSTSTTASVTDNAATEDMENSGLERDADFFISTTEMSLSTTVSTSTATSVADNAAAEDMKNSGLEPDNDFFSSTTEMSHSTTVSTSTDASVMDSAAAEDMENSGLEPDNDFFSSTTEMSVSTTASTSTTASVTDNAAAEDMEYSGLEPDNDFFSSTTEMSHSTTVSTSTDASVMDSAAAEDMENSGLEPDADFFSSTTEMSVSTTASTSTTVHKAEKTYSGDSSNNLLSSPVNTGLHADKVEVPMLSEEQDRTTPGWMIIVGFVVGLAALVIICVAIATRDRWNGPSQALQGMVETKEHSGDQQGEVEMETFLPRDNPTENGQAGEYTIIPLDELPERESLP